MQGLDRDTRAILLRGIGALIHGGTTVGLEGVQAKEQGSEITTRRPTGATFTFATRTLWRVPGQAKPTLDLLKLRQHREALQLQLSYKNLRTSCRWAAVWASCEKRCATERPLVHCASAGRRDISTSTHMSKCRGPGFAWVESREHQSGKRPPALSAPTAFASDPTVTSSMHCRLYLRDAQPQKI